MIGKLKGTIDHSEPDHVVVDVGGVGYVVHCSQQTLATLPPVGSEVVLFTDLLVREDLLQLNGFLTQNEREFFRRLLTVPGVGNKAAQSVIGTLGVTDSLRAISLENWQALRAAPMVGPKLAQRIVNELKNRIEDIVRADGQHSDSAQAVSGPGASTPRGSVAELRNFKAQPGVQSDAVSALVNLGYSAKDAASAVAAVARSDANMAAGEIIRDALKHLAESGA
ncbi:MAG: Holliday junction branch migration protein RuvA [Rhodobacteraceae bacterium]|nr:Holliday junction branch migration protein RuvA [Paracoccaceae bacterium]